MKLAQSVLPAYGIDEKSASITIFGKGLINQTWKVVTNDKEYILQRVNTEIFTKPEDIAINIKEISAYLKSNHPDYPFVAPIVSTTGTEMVFSKGEGFFRLFPFVTGSHTKEVVETPEQAYEAALQFGKFTKLLSGFDARRLKITLPSFHDLSLRYEQFLRAVKSGNPVRVNKSKALTEYLFQHIDIVKEYKSIKTDSEFLLRVTHHDTKISNVLFSGTDKGICVIDLDTIMPGYFISDIGDMMRTYLCPVSEEESDFSRIVVRDDFYKAIKEGYRSEMGNVLTTKESSHFFYSGKFMMYMQALRFLTDYLNNDTYYGASYKDHNFVRAGNQIALLQRFNEKKHVFK